MQLGLKVKQLFLRKKMQKQQHQQQKNGPAKPTNKQTPEVWLHSPGMTPPVTVSETQKIWKWRYKLKYQS